MIINNKEYGFCGIICSDCKNYKKNMNCQGCLNEKNLLIDCPTRSCIFKRGIDICSQCEDFPCKMMNEFYNDGNPNHKKAYVNLIDLINEKHSILNKQLWNQKTKIHVNSKFYDVEGFKNGKSSLLPIELSEVGDVKGKKLLHLQCHFGLDTLSWARLGASVTGVDFSEEAISYAKNLAKELDIKANFICSDIYKLKENLNEKESFDIVYTSYGVLCWLYDLKKWAQIIFSFLKNGGFFYIVELHPFMMVFENEEPTKDFKVSYPYFHQNEAMVFQTKGTYADKNSKIESKSYEWNHSVSDIINSLIEVGLKIEFFNEHPFSCYDHFPFMKKREDGLWILDSEKIKVADLPLSFSIMAKKL